MAEQFASVNRWPANICESGRIKTQTAFAEGSRVTSALPPKADLSADIAEVSQVPNSDIRTAVNGVLFDHHVCGKKQLGRDFDAKRFRGLQVYGQFKLGSLLHWEVGRLLALEDAAGIVAG